MSSLSLSFARRTLTTLARATHLDLLEGRTFFSASQEVISIDYRGESVRAVKDAYVVSVKSGVDFTKLASKAGFTDVRSLGGGGFFAFDSTLTPAQINRWSASHKSSVLAVSPDFLYSPNLVSTDPYYQFQYGANNTGATVPDVTVASDDVLASSGDVRQIGVAGADINLQRAWDITTGSADVIVAVVDSGLDIAHPDLASNLWINPGEVANDGLDNDGNGYIDDVNGFNTVDNNASLIDTIGHGTAVASVISASGDNAIGIAGVTWNSKIMTLKVDDVSGSYPVSATVAAYDYIVTQKRLGANVVVANLSFGGPSTQDNPVQRAAIRRLTDAGVIAVASAGNDSVDNDRQRYFPQRATALGSRVLTVAATDNQDRLASFSSFGATTVDVAAPGVQILMAASADASIADVGANTLLAGTLGTDNRIHGYVTTDGTSFSSPMVAGVIALAKAAFPQATPDQLVAAVRQGVDVLPSLQGSTSRAPRKVATAGRVDAYNTLRILQNQVTSQVDTLAGNWVGTYGTTANFIYGLTPSTNTLPFATTALVPTGSAIVGPLRIDELDTRLPLAADGLSRSTFQLATPTSLSIGFDFGATTQRLTVYVADVERQRISQTVQIVDTSTGLVLQSVLLSNFQAGRYVSFDLTGNVTLRVNANSSRGAVLSALFLDPTPASPATVTATDSLTRGDWVNTYGDAGFVLPGTATALPAEITFNPGAAQLVTPRTTRDPLALESIASSTVRSANFYTSDTGSFDVSLNITDSSARSVAFYIANPARTTRTQRLSVVDPITGVVSTSLDIVLTAKSSRYVTLALSGNNTIRSTSLGGGSPTLNGIFVNSTIGSTGNSVAFVGSDTTTQGRWRGQYGTDGVFIVGESSITDLPTSISLGATAPVNSTYRLVSATTRDPRAPQVTSGTLTANTIGYLQTTSTFDLPITFTDSTRTHRVSAYFVDFDRKGRVQTVELIDPATNTVLSTQTLREFRNGTYLTWDVAGDVTLRITRDAGPNAVLSAVFFA